MLVGEIGDGPGAFRDGEHGARLNRLIPVGGRARPAVSAEAEYWIWPVFRALMRFIGRFAFGGATRCGSCWPRVARRENNVELYRFRAGLSYVYDG